jgi:hypothetical protein
MRFKLDSNVGQNLHNLNQTLEKQNEIIQQILDIMPKPVSKFTRVLETIVLFISVFGFISIADIIIRWIIGG